MVLFLELGNTNLKAAYLNKQDYRFLGRVSHAAIANSEFVSIFDLHDLKIEKIYLCSVANPQIEADLVQAIKLNWQVYPHLLKSEPSSCGIENGYDDFSKLGADRWMSIIALHSSKPYIVVDSGTALTIDLVLEKKYQGGFIVPGLDLMTSSLQQGTALLLNQTPTEKSNETALLATNTLEGIHGGCLSMTAGFINTTIAELEGALGRKLDCYGTGGSFLAIQPLLSKSFEYIEDLTLLGMVELVEDLKK